MDRWHAEIEIWGFASDDKPTEHPELAHEFQTLGLVEGEDSAYNESGFSIENDEKRGQVLYIHDVQAPDGREHYSALEASCERAGLAYISHEFGNLDGVGSQRSYSSEHGIIIRALLGDARPALPYDGWLQIQGLPEEERFDAVAAYFSFDPRSVVVRRYEPAEIATPGPLSRPSSLAG
jgi:hypothetical protein